MVKCREIYHTWTVWAMLQSLLRVTLRWVWSNTRYKQVSWSMLEPGLRSGDSCHPKNSAARLFQPNNETNDLQFNHHIHGFSSNPPRNKKKHKRPTNTNLQRSFHLFVHQTKQNPQLPQTSRSQVLFDSSCRPRRWSFPRGAGGTVPAAGVPVTGFRGFRVDFWRGSGMRW